MNDQLGSEAPPVERSGRLRRADRMIDEIEI
jgi:hypothetical protein